MSELAHKSVGPPAPSREQQWRRVVALGDRLHLRGFSAGQELGTTEHEVRALDCRMLDESRLLVIAGDKAGRLSGGVFRRATAEVEGRPWTSAAMPTDAAGDSRVVDALRIVGQGEQLAVVVGTRGNGAWLVPLLPREGLPAAGPLEARALPGSEGLAIRHVLFDPRTQTVLCAAGTRILRWSLRDGQPGEKGETIDLGLLITAMVIDPAPSGDARPDVLWLATNERALHRIPRGPGGAFAMAPAGPAAPSWRSPEDVIQHLVPLSGLGPPRVRGVIAGALRHLVILAEDDGGEPLTPVVRTVTPDTEIIHLVPLPLPGTRGVLVFTLEGAATLFRPSAAHDAEGSPAPIEALLSEAEPIGCFADRVYASGTLPAYRDRDTTELPLVVGLGDHHVALHHLTDSRGLEKALSTQVAQLVEREGIGSVLGELEARALSAARRDRLRKRSYLALLPEIGVYCRDDADWARVRLLVWDLLARGEDMPDIPVMAVQSLRRLQERCPERSVALEALIGEIRKYVLDRRSFSGKRTHFIELLGSRDPALADDRTLYRAILISRRHDPVFERRFSAEDRFGEVRAFSPVVGPEPRGQDNSWDRIDPAALRLLVTTYRGGIWMLSGEGEAHRLSHDRDHCYVRNFYFRRDDVVLALTDGTMLRVTRQDLARAWDEHPQHQMRLRPLHPGRSASAQVYAMCSVPGSCRWEDDRFLTGDAEGVIALEREGQRVPLFDLGAVEAPAAGERRQVYDIRSSALRFGDRTHRIVVACTASGYLHLLRFVEDPQPRLEAIGQPVRLGSQPSSCLLYPDPEIHQIVVGARDGKVVAYQIVEQEVGWSLALLPVWAYQAAEEVRALHLYRASPRPYDPGEVRSPLVLVASHDQHLHLLDLQGRLLEVYALGMKVDRFVVGHPSSADDPQRVDARVYACAFENQVRGFRLVSRRRLLGEFERELAQLCAPGQLEDALTRWRAYAIKEGHLRHRFILTSSRYPSSSPWGCIWEIKKMLAGEGSSRWRTGEITALLRRLFHAGPAAGPPAGLRAVFADPELYLASVELLKDLANRWNTPGTAENRRVQLYWIRTVLRRIEDRQMLARWREVASEVTAVDAVLAFAPEALLQHFVEHHSELLQWKALEYLERLLFGWPGVDRPGLLLRPERIDEADLRWIVGVLLGRLRLMRRSLTDEAPRAVVLMIARILGLLVMHGVRDPIYLAHQLREAGVDPSIYRLLADQCAATQSLLVCTEVEVPWVDDQVREACQARLTHGSRVMRQAHELNVALRHRHRGPTGHAAVVKALEGMIALCDASAASGADARYVEEVRCYFSTLLPVLAVRNLDRLCQLDPAMLEPAYEPQMYRSVAMLGRLRPALEAATGYRRRKWGDWDRAMESLRFIDMDRWRWRWEEAREALLAAPAGGFEGDLLRAVSERWSAIYEAERDRNLLRDMTRLVEQFLLREPAEVPPDREQAVALLHDERRLTLRAFSNYVTRLALFAGASEALFFYLDPDADAVRGRILRPKGSEQVWHLTRFENEQRLPGWVDPGWRDAQRVPALELRAMRRFIVDAEPEVEWDVKGIPSVAGEDSRFHGFYVLGWRKDDPAGRQGYERFNRHRLAWHILLEAMALRQSSLEHRAQVGQFYALVAHNLGTPLYHIKSDLEVLCEGWFEDDAEARNEKYHDLLRQARHMDGQFDSILSLTGRAVQVATGPVAVPQVVYDVVRAVRKYEARAKGIRVDYPRPADPPDRLEVIETDGEKLYDIVLSLVSNAVKYSPRDSQVQVVVLCNERGADVRVTDRGPGVVAEDRPFIFDPYYRGRAAVETGEPGVGLGLYTVRLFSELLGGRVSIHNQKGGGTTFSLFLPRY